MPNAKKTLLYTAYFIAAAAIFLYYLFPSDAVVRQIEVSVKRANPEYDITIDHIGPAFPPGLRLEAAELRHRNQALLKADQLRVSPVWLSLFTEGSAFSFTGRAHGGILSGQVMITGNNPDRRLDGKLDLSGIKLETLTAISNLAGHRISGLLGAKINYIRDGSRENAAGNLLLQDAKIGFQTPVFNLEELGFKSIITDFLLENQILKIKDCVFKGDQINGSISGSVRLADVPGESGLNLSGTLQPQALFLAELRKSVPIDMIFTQRPGENGFGFRVEGTLDNPNFSLK